MRLLRLARIQYVALKYGLDEFLTGHERFRAVRPIARALTFWRDTSAPRGERLRLALQDLGPIFVKFGQMLSTRRDILPPDIADELAKLQDAVPPFPSRQVVATLTRFYGRPLEAVFRSFDPDPVASASVAQVHFAELPDGTPVAVKVLRQNRASTRIPICRSDKRAGSPLRVISVRSVTRSVTVTLGSVRAMARLPSPTRAMVPATLVKLHSSSPPSAAILVATKEAML